MRILVDIDVAGVVAERLAFGNVERGGAMVDADMAYTHAHKMLRGVDIRAGEIVRLFLALFSSFYTLYRTVVRCMWSLHRRSACAALLRWLFCAKFDLEGPPAETQNQAGCTLQGAVQETHTVGRSNQENSQVIREISTASPPKCMNYLEISLFSFKVLFFTHFL